MEAFQWNCSKVLIVHAYLYGKTGRFGAGTVDLVHQLLAVHFLRSPEEAGHCEAQGKARALIQCEQALATSAAAWLSGS